MRNADGSMISPIHCTYGSNIGAAAICFGYKKDGTHDHAYTATDVSNGILTLDSTTYFILIVKYSTVDLTLYTMYGTFDYAHFKENQDIPALTDIDNMEIVGGGDLKRDIIGFMPSNDGKTITAANFALSTLYDCYELGEDNHLATAYHEAGHAVISELLHPHSIAAVSRPGRLDISPP